MRADEVKMLDMIRRLSSPKHMARLVTRVDVLPGGRRMIYLDDSVPWLTEYRVGGQVLFLVDRKEET